MHVGLTPDDAVHVLEEVLSAQNHSYVLGLKLKLPLYVVDSIHSPTHPQPRDRLLQVIIAFLQQVQPRPTWRAIVDALRSPAVDLPQLALRIERNRCVSTPQAHPSCFIRTFWQGAQSKVLRMWGGHCVCGNALFKSQMHGAHLGSKPPQMKPCSSACTLV